MPPAGPHAPTKGLKVCAPDMPTRYVRWYMGPDSNGALGYDHVEVYEGSPTQPPAPAGLPPPVCLPLCHGTLYAYGPLT